MNQFKLHIQYINITYSTDIRTYLISIVSITSLMEHSTNRNLYYNIYILISPGFDPRAIKLFESLNKKYQRLMVKTVTVNYTFPNLTNFKSTSASAFRLFTPLIFPDMKRLIHLDCDTLVFKDLDYFYNLNMSNLQFRGNFDFDIYGDLIKRGYPNDRYINAGVLLMNLDEIRNSDFIQKAFNYTKKYGCCLKLPIQAIINSVSYDKCDFVPPEIGFFNCFATEETYKNYFRSIYIKKYYKEEDIHKILNNLTIVHLIFKPWGKIHNVTYSKEWAKMALKTDFADVFIRLYPWITNL